MTKISRNLLNLSTQQRTDGAHLQGMKAPSRHAVPKLSRHAIPGVPSLAEKDGNNHWRVDYYQAAVPQLRSEWRLLGTEHLVILGPFAHVSSSVMGHTRDIEQIFIKHLP